MKIIFYISMKLNIDRRFIMIKMQIIRENTKPIAVILDYNEYKRLKEIEENKTDYLNAVNIKKINSKWIRHEDLKSELGLEDV